MRYVQFTTLFLAFLLLLAARAAAQSAPIELGPVEAINIALARNPNLQAARSGIAEAESQRVVARSMFLPRLAVNHTYLRTDQPVAAFGTLLNQGGFTMDHFAPDRLNDPEAINDHHTQIVVQQPVYNGGKQFVGVKLADTGIEMAQAMAEQAIHNIIFQTVKAFYDYVLASGGQAVASEAVKLAEASVSMIERLHEQGMAVRSDLLSARVQLAKFRQDELSAANHARLAARMFNLLLGDPEGTYVPRGGFAPASCPTLDLAELQLAALSQRPDVAQLRTEVSMAAHQRKLAAAEFLPNFNLQGTWDRHSDDISGADTSYTIAAAFSWNLFNGMADKAKTAAQRQAMERLTKQLTALEHQVQLEVEKAYSDLHVACDMTEVAREAVSQAEENLKIVSSRYEQGVTTIVDFLGAQLALSSAKIDLLKAEHAAAVGQAALCQATGNIHERWQIEAGKQY